MGRIADRRRPPAARFEGYTNEQASTAKKIAAQRAWYQGDAWYRTGDLMVRHG